MLGSFFAIALLIVSLMVTASSWDYMKGKANPAAYYSLILLSSVGMVLIAYSTDLRDAICFMGINVVTNLRSSGIF